MVVDLYDEAAIHVADLCGVEEVDKLGWEVTVADALEQRAKRAVIQRHAILMLEAAVIGMEVQGEAVPIAIVIAFLLQLLLLAMEGGVPYPRSYIKEDPLCPAVEVVDGAGAGRHGWVIDSVTVDCVPAAL